MGDTLVRRCHDAEATLYGRGIFAELLMNMMMMNDHTAFAWRRAGKSNSL